MKPLHVAFFNRSFHPDTSATGQLLTELCESLVANHGCRVSVVAGMPLLPAGQGSGGASGWVLARETHAGIEVLRARGTRLSKRRFVGRATNYVTYFLSACYAGLRLDRPDVVVALTDPPILGLAGLHAWPFPADHPILGLIEAHRPVLVAGFSYAYATVWFSTPFFVLNVLSSVAYIFLADLITQRG